MERRAKSITSILLIEFLLLHNTLSQHGFEESAAARTLKQESHHTHEVHCSRERSRVAWQIIEEYLMPFVEEEGYQISTKCRFHPDNDIFRDQEEHKIYLDINEWRCGYCKKSFRAENFLDQHFDNRHYNLLNVNQSKCLADLCGALHCDFFMNSKLLKAKCNPVAVARNRHLCESLADSCFPITQGSYASRLHELFLHQFCDAHTCSGKINPFPKGGKNQSKCLADLCGALHCDFFMNSKLLKAKCNPVAVARNRHLCESLADSCFPITQGSYASRLHELFLHQFCDAHTCSGKINPFPKGGKKQTSLLYMTTSILILMLLPIFYLLYYLYQRDMKRGTQVLRRVSQVGRKTKPS